MFLHELGASDSRFKQLKFHQGMNILLADKTSDSTLGDSRNGAGKTSFVRILRYLLGGRIDGSLKAKSLSNYTFWAKLEIASAAEVSHVRRPVSPQTKVYVDGTEIKVEDWKHKLSSMFNLSEAGGRPTVGQLVGQLLRDFFSDPLKTYHVESGWESGTRIGFFLGFSPEILSKAGEVTALEKNKKALKKAISAGAFGTANSNEPELRARLARTREKRTRLESNLSGFRVDEQYTEHQDEADRLTQTIRELNDESLSLQSRKRDLELARAEVGPAVEGTELARQLESLYAEIGIVLPGAVARRFSEVTEFYSSVVRNRQMFLESELLTVKQRLADANSQRQALDQRRARVMNLLNESMALETFRTAERELVELDATVANLEQRLELVQSVSDTGLRLRAMKSEAEASMRTEIADRELHLEAAIVLFQRLGEEIYNDRNVSLLIEATQEGVLKVVPKIDGDASAGILGVKTFLLDMVCAVTAIQLGRAPRILVHDSQLFDSMDDRQLASCLNIGARLADDVGFQYVVTLNSDRLLAAESEGFDRSDYVIQPVLTDTGDEGGLFGFRFV